MADGYMVTIEGSPTPSAELARGERRDVVLTDRIKGLVKKGFIVIVGDPRPIGGSVPADEPQTVEATGEPNVGHELPADGQMHDISLPGIEPETPLAQVVPDEAAAEAGAALHDHG